MGGVNYVFHAAALKQVPTAEFFPWEAIKTNSIGAQNVIDSAIRHNIQKVVVLSTDKAVYPISANCTISDSKTISNIKFSGNYIKKFNGNAGSFERRYYYFDRFR